MKAFLPLLFFLLTVTACRENTAPPTSPAPAAAANESAAGNQESTVRDRLAPDELFGELFRRVQMERVFADGKTFVDMVPKFSAEEIMSAYGVQKGKADFDLKAFVERYFNPPVQPKSGFVGNPDRDIVEHIDALWPVLTRRAGADEGTAGSLIPLPKDYVVPGGRFREIYYWDSYFTLLGLLEAGETRMARNMVDNFAYLIETVGHVPNGNRTYYLTRSQPPFFSLMVDALPKQLGENTYLHYLPALKKEHAFWMKGADRVSAANPAVNHVVRMPDGSLLNRYYDAGDRPRAESYREDVMTIRESGRDSQTVARHLRSGAESGWDYSARWFADQENISSIITTDIVPPDLNSLLYHLETIIAEKGTDEDRKRYGDMAAARARAVNTYLYDEDTKFYQDYNWTTGRFTDYLTLAGVYPLFVGLADNRRAANVGEVVAEKFLAPGGVRTSLEETGQQWDAPNGWAPLQYITYRGLRSYNERTTANFIRNRWMANNERVYGNVTKMVEKYNVENLGLEAGGGEYPVQDGFGWSNGVYLRFKAEK